MGCTQGIICLLYLVTFGVFAAVLWQSYKRVVESLDRFDKTVSKPCREITKGVREARQCAKAVSSEVKEFWRDEENRKELKRAVATILILGIAVGISDSIQKILGGGVKKKGE